MNHDEWDATRRLIYADAYGDMQGLLDDLIVAADDLELDAKTLEIVRLRFEARFVGSDDDEE